MVAVAEASSNIPLADADPRVSETRSVGSRAASR
jgi:hypothetical protein